MADAMAVRDASELIRERETFKYDPTLLDGVTFNETGEPLPGEQLFTADDTVLTCLAQLGVCRTGTGRSLVSLFDQRWQYIVAEATPTMPLVAGVNHHHLMGENLWLSRTAIPRVHGVCNHTLVDPGSKDCPAAALPLTIASDLTSDSRFCDSPFCAPGSLARFYAAVPIRTPGGINIGVYCVIDNEPRPVSTWTENDTAILRSVSRSIMSHLVCRSTNAIQKKNDRMTQGILSFMEAAKSEYSSLAHLEFGLVKEPREDEIWSKPSLSSMRGGERANSQTSPVPPTDSIRHNVASAAKSETVGGEKPPLRSHIPRDSLKSDSGLDLSSTMKRTLAQAADAVRDALDTDGMVFLDASVTGFGSLAGPFQSNANDKHDFAAESKLEDANSHCAILASSTREPRADNAPPSLGKNVQQIPTQYLSTLCRRYPAGKIFTYDEQGAILCCDPPEDIQPSVLSSSAVRVKHSDELHADDPTYAGHQELEILSKYFPGARTVVFVPVRDDQKERWFAGGFAYTSSPTYIASQSGELSYLQAFSTLVMAAVRRVHITFAHKAQSDVLNSLSHELRSPLHGVILCTELLADTSLDVFQGDTLHTLETCGRTLLDTIDHLLDFSNINNYLDAVQAEKKSRGNRVNATASIEAGMKSLYSDINLDYLVEEVTESVCAGHYLQHMPSTHPADWNRRLQGVRASNRANSERTVEDMALSKSDVRLLRNPPGNVSVYLDIDASISSYRFFSMAGAIRRIVMNLVGNALKFTRKGTICVSLTMESDSDMTLDEKQKVVRLTVADTGIGMSHDFLQNELYRPFHQSDQLLPGVGLGLSLTKKIVSSLSGDISIESELNVGTLATVLLPLSPALLSATEDATEQFERGETASQRQELRGLRVRLIGFQTSEGLPVDNVPKKDLHIENLCRDWLQMEVLTDSQGLGSVPDLVLCSDTGFEEAGNFTGLSGGPPVVVICANVHGAYQMSTRNNLPNSAGIFEFISQPVGPLKLTRTLSHTFRRWIDLQDSTALPKAKALHLDTPCDMVSEPSCSLSASDATRRSSPIQSPSTDQTNSLECLSKGTTIDGSPGSPYSDSAVSFDASAVGPTTLVASRENSGRPIASHLSQEMDQPEFLLVDDNPVNLRMLCVFMRKLGRQYSTAEDGQEAIDAFQCHEGSLKYIFMDISMPRVDGMEATRQIRAFERQNCLKPVTIFALTGLASAEVQQEAFGSGIDLFLTKPVKLKELVTILTERGALSNRLNKR